MSRVTLRNLQKTYEGTNTATLHGVDLTIEHGEFMVFVGPSGCGKTTLMRMIAGLEDITAGDLYIGDQLSNDIPPAKRGVAMVFQSYALYPHLSVFENMAFGLRLSQQPERDIKERVNWAAEVLQITHLLDRKPKALSGGQRQRVAIGRAIVRQPKVFLFDEPLSNLDASLRVQMRVELSKLHRKLKTTMIYVTHDQVEAMTLGDRICVFNQGRIEQIGTPLELYDRPRNLFVASFLGSPKMNLLSSTVDTVHASGVTLRLPDNTLFKVPLDGQKLKLGQQVTLGLRPEHVHECTTGKGIEVRVDLLEHVGDALFAYVQLPGMKEFLIVKLAPEAHHHRVGDKIKIELNTRCCHLFDREGRALPPLPGSAWHVDDGKKNVAA
ncbi:multiple sugar transport system ATP-binding protein [Chitinivorax tropicus]|uniref:Multiple sugar transport system ATP-binding protein n=1 Tax=Chitinivorax tropicus TaxID=714531 RepID=A0A840MJP5_9PROT|nr:sn-glycerol-3-phosphate ABC transporter ATP-binding protein UgpC [Chitinivorax tropicus]MBB5018630.1 multiple sugar transport system ATP-binding protein [Chitinivorax tropicus]